MALSGAAIENERAGCRCLEASGERNAPVRV